MYVIPVQGRVVPDPFRGDDVPPQGRNVEPGQHWFKLINEGVLTEGQPPREDAPLKKEGG